MPDLEFQITGVKPAADGITPLLKFYVAIHDTQPAREIRGILLKAQIQIEAPRRDYSPQEQAKLIDLFGRPAQWGQNLRSRFWITSTVIVSPFTGQTTVELEVPCTYDLNIAGSKYCCALAEGEVPLLFLFSGTVFYVGAEGRLQVQQIAWDKEAPYRMPVRSWWEMLDRLYPHAAWLYLDRDVFDRLYDYKLSHGLATWEQTMEHLLAPVPERNEVLR